MDQITAKEEAIYTDRKIYGNFSDNVIYKLLRELRAKIKDERPTIQYEEYSRSYWNPEDIHTASEEVRKDLEANYLEMVRLNDPNNVEELKEKIYSNKIKYDIWGLTFPVWGTLGIPALKPHYLVSREYYESSRKVNY